MTESVLQIEDLEHVRILRLDRPEKLNAFNFALLRALADAVRATALSRDVRVVVVTGAGDRAFSAGADLAERATLTRDEVREFLALIRDTFTRLEQLPQPVIAAVNGVALGGGCELALAADIRLASDRALMGLTETGLGIIPGAGGTQRLPRLVGRGRAREMVFSARRVSAQEALDIGLVEALHPPTDLMEAALDLARRIAGNAPLAVTQAKLAINRGLETDLATGLALEGVCYETLIPSRDRLEGLAAFREKRAPRYTGE
ncbi:MAG: enoyl-CoA hydratase-related protein [bacterium]|nr:enoyl-CoA hydratase-related protein [bacterium]